MSRRAGSLSLAHDSAQRPDRGRGLRLLVLASTFPRWEGDAEPPFVFNLSRRLAERFEVTVLAPHARGAAVRERVGGVEVMRFRYFWPTALQRLAYGGILPNLKRHPWLWLQVPFFLLFELLATYRAIRLIRPDVIHAHWLIPQGLVASLAGLITRTPFVVTAHGGDVYGLKGGLRDALKGWVMSRATRVTAVSEDLRRSMEEVASSSTASIEVIPMGVDTSLFQPRSKEVVPGEQQDWSGPTLLFVGRLAEKKGVAYLLEAMPSILRRFPDARLQIIGDGPLRGPLELQAALSGVAGRVEFLGGLPGQRLPAYYRAADVFIAPSIVAGGGDTESFGVVIAEAMATGCPVVASDVGGIRDLVTAETGILVPQRDPAAIAAAVADLLDDDARRRRLARSALERVRARFDQRALADRYRSLLQEAAT
jgi:glycosyltransferase involved in cell wall biosynthesis